MDAGFTGVLHVHSDYSHDGRDSLEQLREMARVRALRFVALTDHAEDFTAERWHTYVAHCAALTDAGVALIPGLEFRFAGYTGLHLLAAGLDRWIAPETPAAFVAEASPACALTIVAHPILAEYRIPHEVREGIDAVEVWNAVYNTRYLPDPRAIRLLHDLRRDRATVVGTVGLDQHDSRNYKETRVIVSSDGANLLAPVRRGEFVNVGRTMRFGPDVGIRGVRFGALRIARWALDRVDHAQESLARARRAWRSSR